MKLLRNFIGWLKGCGQCAGCKDRWNWKTPVWVEYAPGYVLGLFCWDCFDVLNKSQLAHIHYLNAPIKAGRLPIDEFFEILPDPKIVMKSIETIKAARQGEKV